MAISVLEAERVLCAKRAFTTRRVGIDDMQSLLTGAITPQTGDVVLARVDEIGKHKRIELTDGRRAHMFPGDEVLLCFGNRYAPDQFEAVIGVDLSPCDLVAAGGIASREISRNLRMIPPTRITPIGLVGDRAGMRLNLRNFAIPDLEGSPSIPIIVSVGTSMNAGKTLAATSVVRGLKSAGYRVAAIKATGTGAGGDLWIVKDAGADVVLDFTDAGIASTYLVPVQEIEAATRKLIVRAARLRCDIAVIEIADGLEQLETARLLELGGLWSNNLGVVFSAYDAMGAKCGVEQLKATGHRVLGVSGRLTISPLAVREATKGTGLRVYSPWELQEGGLNATIIAHAHDMFPENPLFSLMSSSADQAFIGSANSGFQKDTWTQLNASEHAGTNGKSVLPPASQPLHSVPDQVLRSMLRFVAEQVMSIEISAICDADLREPGRARTNRRSGYRHCRWATQLGTIDVKVPRLRKRGYQPQFLKKRNISKEHVKALVSETWDPGAAGGSLQTLLDAMGVDTLSGREVERLRIDILQKAGLPPVDVNTADLPAELIDVAADANDISNRNGARLQLPGAYDEADEEDDFHVAASSAKGPLDPVPEWQLVREPNAGITFMHPEQVLSGDELEEN